MNVTVMLAWYDEDPDILYRAVTSSATIADRIVAADGRWDLYPGDRGKSPADQYEAIRDAANDVGLRYAIHYQGQPWTGQIEKRNHLLRMARAADWVMPLDADWELHGNRQTVREQLGTARADAFTVQFHTPANPDADPDDAAATGWHKQLAGVTIREPLIFRNLPGIRIEGLHWLYSGLRDGRRVALWGAHYPPASTHPLSGLRVDHHCLHRDRRTVEANRAYCALRDEHVAAHGKEP